MSNAMEHVRRSTTKEAAAVTKNPHMDETENAEGTGSACGHVHPEAQDGGEPQDPV